MILRTVALIALMGFGAASGSGAQTLGNIGGPREQPPAGYQGQMYVDSRGCVFLRAGFGGQVNWVPRVTAARRPLCGYPPTLGPRARVEVAESEPARGRPIDTVASITTPPTIRAAPPATTARVPQASYVPATPRRAVAPRPQETSTGSPVVRRDPVQVASGGVTNARRIGCYASAPVARRVALTTGGSAVVCTSAEGTMAGARPPIYPAGSGVGASLSEGRDMRAPAAARNVRTATPASTYAASPMVIPEGYKAAWTDGRLNPMRGKGTAEGQARQDRVWTRKVPQTLVEDTPKARRTAPKLVASAKNAPVAPGRAVQAYVQVGTFGQPSNADGAAARLGALGLPVARSRVTKSGAALQVIMAGPFRDPEQAKSALAAARRAGFSDAFLR